MQTPEGISIVPATPKEILALLTSAELAAVESPIAKRCGFNILPELGAATTSSTQAEVSVSGMTVIELNDYLVANRERLIDFGVRFLGDKDATSDEQEYPAGEEQDADGESKSLGYGVGFGMKCAIYHNFLANRSAAEFRAFLKNRRIPKHTKFAKELTRIFAESESSFAEEA